MPPPFLLADLGIKSLVNEKHLPNTLYSIDVTDEIL